MKPLPLPASSSKLLLAALVGVAVSVQPRSAPAQCKALMESKSSMVNSNKCGFPECQPSTPPKFFLTKTTTVSDRYNESKPSGLYSQSMDTTEVVTMARYPRPAYSD